MTKMRNFDFENGSTGGSTEALTKQTWRPVVRKIFKKV
jgi:hypothetical protein